MQKMRVRIVCYEDVNAWILGKFAIRLNEQLRKLSVDSDIAKVRDPKADINHHIFYAYQQGATYPNDTFMITHVDSVQKLQMIKSQLKTGGAAICMSVDTMRKLIVAGVPKDKLFFVNPAHDGIIKPRPLVIGLTHKIHKDGRKNDNLVYELSKHISPDDFMFKIMGGGWNRIIDMIRKRGFRVEYYDEFDYDTYTKLVPTFDYFLYYGFDEGTMGFLDVLSAGVKTVVTPQGYHLDAPGGLVYPIKNITEIVRTFQNIALERRKLVQSVSSWTWENYAREHLALWRCIVDKSSLRPLLNTKLRKMRLSPYAVRYGERRLDVYLSLLPMTIRTAYRGALKYFFQRGRDILHLLTG